ncbi:hypothetical protein E2C01_010010 [Portunus trituberculatus]|uniref:Uncharacterized protein n=1 Tax=Portunus trituberculatus TaxID=210409 RepID=A0A5B7D7C2_PORTR|nr:hypothetical protein [Portunus trituberculatus]
MTRFHIYSAYYLVILYTASEIYARDLNSEDSGH